MTEHATDAASLSKAEHLAMQRAVASAQSRGVPLGPNPRVGCVLLGPDGREIAGGHHRGAGTPHAEVVALHRAGRAAHGATAVVTLEPCSHTGRTGPCSEALLAAGVARVVFGRYDPDPVASGGAQALRSAGVDVVAAPAHPVVADLNRYWEFGIRHDRPYVTWKLAVSLDGRVAARDGSSRWITGPEAREDVHRLRRRSDAVLVGTGTALTDDPALTVRAADGPVPPRSEQPMRAVMGLRELPPDAVLRDGAAETCWLHTRDPRVALRTLFDAGRRHVLLEGGPTLSAAFARAGLVDEVVAYVAPALLGSGRLAVDDIGVASIDQALRLEVVDVTVLGTGPGRDVRLVLRPSTSATEGG